MTSSINRKTISWALYDWANSSFSTTVMAGFFPVFFKEYWSQGVDVTVTTSRLGMSLSIVGLLIAIFSPFLGVLADQRGAKKNFTMLFMIVGAGATIALGSVSSGQWTWALYLYGLAQIGFAAASVFNDALLSTVTPKENVHRVSALGYSLGYLGGGLLFALNVLMFQFPEKFGLANGVEAVKASFISVGVWWAVFSLPMYIWVPEPSTTPPSGTLWNSFRAAVSELNKTFIKLLDPSQRPLLWFLFGYWLYIDGVYTVMTMAVDYGQSIGIQAKDLIAALLITQFIGFPATLIMGWLDRWIHPKHLILACIGVYMTAVILSTQMTSSFDFYLLATAIGIVQGGVQSLSRSLFSKMVPLGSEGEYFGFFNQVGRFASILGPLLISVSVTLTGDPKKGILSLLILFVAGVYFLLKTPRTI